MSVQYWFWPMFSMSFYYTGPIYVFTFLLYCYCYIGPAHMVSGGELEVWKPVLSLETYIIVNIWSYQLSGLWLAST